MTLVLGWDLFLLGTTRDRQDLIDRVCFEIPVSLALVLLVGLLRRMGFLKGERIINAVSALIVLDILALVAVAPSDEIGERVVRVSLVAFVMVVLLYLPTRFQAGGEAEPTGELGGGAFPSRGPKEDCLEGDACLSRSTPAGQNLFDRGVWRSYQTRLPWWPKNSWPAISYGVVRLCRSRSSVVSTKKE